MSSGKHAERQLNLSQPSFGLSLLKSSRWDLSSRISFEFSQLKRSPYQTFLPAVPGTHLPTTPMMSLSTQNQILIIRCYYGSFFGSCNIISPIYVYYWYSPMSMSIRTMCFAVLPELITRMSYNKYNKHKKRCIKALLTG